MPVDDETPAPEPGAEAPLKFEEAPAGGAQAPAPLTPKGRRGWRRVVNRRNAMWTGIVLVVAVIALAVIIFILYRSGQVDRIIARQVVGTFAKYNIRAEVGSFETKFGPRTAELRDLKLYDATTGAQLGKIDRIVATIRIEDMYALSLSRDVKLEELTIDGLESWVAFDAEGRSNFRNVKLPPPDPNSRILFSYSTARIRLNGAVIHYDDKRYDISGEARNLRAFIRPEDPNAPEESRMNLVEVALSDSSFVYNGRPVNNIDINANARVNQVRAEIGELTLRSPLAEARLSGVLDDWRKLSYRMQVNASVDLTQTSDVLQLEAAVRGNGQFQGTVTGEGDDYKVEGQIVSDAIAADNVRLKALNVTGTATGSGKTYEAQGRAVAELLTAGDFQLNTVQLVGKVMGTGADFNWVGDLRAAAARGGATSITGLILKDATAEMRGEELSGGAESFSASSFVTEGARVAGAQGSNVRFKRDAEGRTTVTASGARAGQINADGTIINGAQASGVNATINPDESASVTVERLNVGGVSAQGVRTGSINIAGVRLAITSGGRVEGTSGDINAGSVALPDGGRAENVRLARPRFVLEPGGRYRASADLSLGGGVLGQMRLGSARAGVVATNNQIQLNDFVADIFNGRATGRATISTAPRGGTSSVAASFDGVDVGGLITTLSGNTSPLTGAATGTVNLSFPGTNFKAASGRLDARFKGEAGRDTAARSLVTGALVVNADRGLFQVESANITTGATTVTAAGRFSFEGGTELAVTLDSSDAAEMQRIGLGTGLLQEIQGKVSEFGVGLAGTFHFDGRVTGDLDNPLVNGQMALQSLTVDGRDMGALSLEVASTAAETRINNGHLTERDADRGGIQFTAVIPRAGENNVSFDATLENANAGNLVAAFGSKRTESLTGLGPASGSVSVRGFPGAMEGSADLRVASGRIGSQAYDEIVARATFSGSKINLERLDARLPAGSLTASGTVDIEQQAFDLRAEGKDVRLDLLTGLLGGTAAAGSVPRLAGLANFTATAAGNLADPTSYRVELNAQGRDVLVNGQPAGELTLTGRTTPDQKFNVELTTGLLGKPQVVRATVDLGSEDLAVTAETTLTGTDLTPLFAALLPDSNVRVTGRATGTLRASGNLLGENGFTTSNLSGRAEFTELVVQVEDVPLTAENPLVVSFTPGEVKFERTRFTGPGTNISFGGTAALGAGGQHDLTVKGDLNLRVLNNLSPNILLAGAANVGVNVVGPFDAPRINGTASVAGATFATFVGDERLTATGINGVVRFNENQARIETLTGTLGGGRISATGGALLVGFRPSQFRFVARAERVTVPLPEDFRTTADADLELSGNMNQQRLKGTVNVRRAEYTEDIDLADLIDRRGQASLTETGTGGGDFLGGRTTIDLAIEGRDALVVRNNLADIVGSLSVRVVGSLEDPVISGRVTATRGTLAFRNDRFEIQRAIIDLPPRRGADPLLNVQAESEIRGYRIIVGITGPLSQPATSLRSDPALPQADVVALITTGNLSTGAEGFSTIAQTGLGTATSLLTESLINTPVRKATDKLFGLNRFEFDPIIAGRGGASPTARLTVGRQINRDLAVTFSTNVTGEPNQVLAVVYRVSDRLSFVAQYQQGATDTLRSRSDNFNFELRFRKRY